ncbi:MAG: aminodeoxychorismate lyase [Thiohalomonadales bacterium]
MSKTEINNAPTLAQLQLDRGLHYGDGLFETIAIKSGIPELLDEHIARLKESCERLKFINVDFLKIKKTIRHNANNLGKGIIKLIVTRGSGGRGYLIPDDMTPTYLLLQYPWPDYNIENWDKGVTIRKCDIVPGNQPLLAGMKHLNRLENVLARMELKNTIFQEGILCDSEQNVIEATSSNVFIVINNKIITPKLEKCGVSGVMRDQVIKKAIANNMQIEIQDIPYKTLLDADEIFLTNSVIGIWPVANLNERMYSEFPITRKLMILLNINYHE